MIKPFLFLLLLFALKELPAQKTGRMLVDSLVLSLEETKDDTAKARLYNRVFNELIDINSAEAMRYAREGLAHTQKMKWAKGTGTFQDNLGRFYSNLGNYDSAVFYYNASLGTQKKAGNKKGMGVSYNNMGVAAQNIKGDFTTAADFYFKALQLAEEEKDSISQANALNNIAGIYMLQKDYSKALDFNKRALRIRELINDLEQVSISLQSIGKTHLLLKDTARAKENFRKGLAISESNADVKGMAAAWSNLSLAYGTDYRAVAEARLKARQLWEEASPIHPEAIANLGNLGIIYFDIATKDSLKKVKYDAIIPADRNSLLKKAEEYLRAAIQLAQQTGDIDNHSFFTGALAEVQEQQGDFKNAYFNYKFFKEAEDSIYSQESKNKIATAESRRTLEIQQLAIINQRRTLWGLIAGIALVSIIGILLYRQTQARKKANRQLLNLNKQLDDANQAKARFFALMSHDLRSPVSKLINFLHLQKNNPELLSIQQVEEHNKRITASAETLLENMETMLLWSKSQMENFKPARKPILVKDVFEKLQKTFINQEPVQFIFGDTGNLSLSTDGDYLFSILYNLIHNATEALQNTGRPVIECSATVENKKVLFSVSDNGPGFPADLLQGQASKREAGSGKKGFGLFIVYDMAGAIDGTITLVNHAAGARALLQLPLSG